MNSHYSASLMVGSIFCLMAAAINTSDGQSPQFLRAAAIGDNVFAFGIRPHTNGWVAIDASPDFHDWSEVTSVATTNDNGFFADETDVRAGRRFYRLRVPGTSAEQAESRWATNSITEYRFELERESNNAPFSITGTVTVTNGQETVTDATADGQPLDQPPLADFPTIKQLFAALELAQADGCWEVYASYDPALGFPVRCLIDDRSRSPQPAEGFVGYRITGLDVLSPSAAASTGVKRTKPNQ